jgi:hypothetical protein
MIWEMSIDRGFTTLALFTAFRGAYAWPLPSSPIGMYYLASEARQLPRLCRMAVLSHEFTLQTWALPTAMTCR